MVAVENLGTREELKGEKEMHGYITPWPKAAFYASVNLDRLPGFSIHIRKVRSRCRYTGCPAFSPFFTLQGVKSVSTTKL